MSRLAALLAWIRDSVAAVFRFRKVRRKLGESGALDMSGTEAMCREIRMTVEHHREAFVLDFRRILADYSRSVLEGKSPAARGKLAAPAFYAILEAARLHGIQPLRELEPKEEREA